MSNRSLRGPNGLREYVIAKNLCSACGACSDLCPYIDMVKGKGAVIVEACGLSDGNCFGFCPRTLLDVPALDRLVFGSQRKDVALGSNISVMKARTLDGEIRKVAQYGGVVSTLVTYALDAGKIDAVVLVKSEDRVSGEPTVARNRKEVLECAGSTYLVCPTVSKVWKATKQEKGRFCVVGTPCQITAIRKMQHSPNPRTNLKSQKDKVTLLIGLFCTWALWPDAYSLIGQTVGGSRVLKVDVPPPPANIFVVHTEDKVFEIPLGKVREFIMPSCNVCFDMTNEFSDISVGAVEGEEGWNTVIVRTKPGQDLLQAAQDVGILEVKPLERERLNHLCEASLIRKRRVLTEKDPDRVGYLLTTDEDKSRIIGEEEVH